VEEIGKTMSVRLETTTRKFQTGEERHRKWFTTVKENTHSAKELRPQQRKDKKKPNVWVGDMEEITLKPRGGQNESCVPWVKRGAKTETKGENPEGNNLIAEIPKTRD